MKKLRIFAASPSDMTTERAKVETVAEMLKPLADNLDIVLDVVDWRAVVPDMGRPEQVILDQLKPTAWDVFIGILWHRFGTPPGGKDPQTQKEYLAGTEEEFKTAHRLWKQFGKPRIIVYRCTRAIPAEALDPDQSGASENSSRSSTGSRASTPGYTNRSIRPTRSRNCCWIICRDFCSITASRSGASRLHLRYFRRSRPRFPIICRAARRFLGETKT